MKYALPRILYYDIGTHYFTKRIHQACELMVTWLMYARLRNPQGTQERINLTMEAFLDDIALKTQNFWRS